MSENTRLRRDAPVFYQMSAPPLPIRLVREFTGALRQVVREPGSYLRVVLLPANSQQWFPRRLGRVIADGVAAFASHPVGFVTDAFSPDSIGKKRRRRLLPILTVMAVLYGAFGLFAIYEAFLSPFAKVRVVDNANYRRFDPNWVTAKIVYPPGMLRQFSSGPTMSIEEIRKHDAEMKRKAEIARVEREKRAKEEEARRAEEAKKEAEAAAKKEADAKAAEAKAAELKEKSKSFGEINVAPIKDIVGKLYNMYQSGDLALADNFKIMVAFRIDPDGSIPRSSIKVVQSSGSKVVDNNALEILWQLGESHALGPLSSLSSNTIALDVNEKVTRLSITSFAPSAEEADFKAKQITFMLKIAGSLQKNKNPAVAELLSRLTVKADNKRVDADMTVPKARAQEMMKTTFAKPSDQGQP